MAEAAETHPDTFVTVKLYVLAANPTMVVLAVFPTMAPGLMVQFPAGKPFNTILPVATLHVGCVIAPPLGADGVAGCAFMTALAETAEVHPAELVTV